MTKLLRPAIQLVLCFWPLQAFAETIYRWTEEKGKMYVTDLKRFSFNH